MTATAGCVSRLQMVSQFTDEAENTYSTRRSSVTLRRYVNSPPLRYHPSYYILNHSEQ